MWCFYFKKKGSKNTPCRCPASRGQTEVSRVERRSFIGAFVSRSPVDHGGMETGITGAPIRLREMLVPRRPWWDGNPSKARIQPISQKAKKQANRLVGCVRLQKGFGFLSTPRGFPAISGRHPWQNFSYELSPLKWFGGFSYRQKDLPLSLMR